MGLPALAADALLTEQAQADPLEPKRPHFARKAKRGIHLFTNGGPSQVGTFDPKPALAKYAGKELPFKFKTERRTGAARYSLAKALNGPVTTEHLLRMCIKTVSKPLFVEGIGVARERRAGSPSC